MSRPIVQPAPDVILEVYKRQLDEMLLAACMEGMMRGAIIVYDHAKSCDKEACTMKVADTIRSLWEKLREDLSKPPQSP